MIRIAVQAKGRLNEDSIRLLNDSGIQVDDSKRKLLSKSNNFPVEILYLRDDDIPQAVANGIADIGIVGLNEVKEKGFKVKKLFDLGFSKCRLSLAVPKSVNYTGLKYFNNKKVATSYPKILKEFFRKSKIKAKIESIAGSVEIAPSIGMTDAIFDIVSSGGTLVSNGLVEVEKVFYSEAVLIATPELGKDKMAVINQMIFRFNAVKMSRGKKYVLVNVPNNKITAALKIIPCLKSPTLLPLADKNWSAIHAVVDEDLIWEKVEQLKKIGAEDILVLNMEQMIL
ncbi:MAG TPA: ATP phosphoribosyltransferase [Candidatus Egerieousia sp.]|nr:ATP phosphoribosyltransferase [Candidatus Egerieousia sp.]HPT06111.1 ATP phosphoribosyltransferase [Candidatus Egerieousia sp.]